MNKIKINEFVNAYSRVIKMSNEIKSILIELMEKIITKYEQIVPYVTVSEDSSAVYLIKPKDGKYSVEDFFLNRLFRNIWQISEITPEVIADGFADASTKGKFIMYSHEVCLNPRFLDVQLNEFKQYYGDNFEEAKSLAFKKVIMHEFEHGLQTVYDDKLQFEYREAYKRISDEIRKIDSRKYNISTKTYESIPKEPGDRSHYISNGITYSSIPQNINKKTYRNTSGIENLNEILNETESLEMAEQKNYLTGILGKSGNKYKLRNPESSNAYISNYGDLFKELLGSQNSFVLMYLNPSKMFEQFNKMYSDIFQSVYNSDKDSIELFIISITKIKKTRSEEEHLKLNYALTKCLEAKVLKFYDNPNVSNEQMMKTIERFSRLSISNNNLDKKRNLPHLQILIQIRENIKNRNVQQSSTKSNEINTLKQFRQSITQHQSSQDFNIFESDTDWDDSTPKTI